MRPVAGVLASAALFVLLAGLEWEGSRARWLRDLHDGDEEHRIEAIHGLVPLAGSEVDEAIAAALVDSSEDVRLEAALACEARGLRACAGPISAWLEDPDADVRAIAARALGRVGTDLDTPRLSRALGDARPQVRRAAVAGLGALGGAPAVQAVISALTDADPIVRGSAVTALAEIAPAASERATAATALLSLVRDEAPEVRAATLDALGALGDPRAGAAATVGLDDDAVEVRLAAMRALTLVPSNVATAALVRASADEDREGRAALAALARTPGDVALDAIVLALHRPSVARSAEDALEVRMRVDEASRVEVVQALARAIDGAPGADRIARLAGSASRLSQRVSTLGLEGALLGALRRGGGPVVIEALGRTGAEEALVPVLDALASLESSTRSAALAGLEGLASVRPPDGRILDPLTLALPRLAPDEQARAVAIVARASSERAPAWLLARLDDGSRDARIAALQALRTRSPASATARFVALLDDADPEMRSRAALALAARALREPVDEAVTMTIAQGLAGDAPRDRHALLLALGPIVRTASEGAAREAAREAILRALDTEDPELADGAALAIAASHDAALARAVLERGAASGPVGTARALRALAGSDLEAARAFVVAHLDASDPVVSTAALATLGEIGGAAELAELTARAPSLRFPASAAAAFAMARFARRGVSSDAVPAALAALATSHDPYVRANVAIAAAGDQLPRVEGTSPIDWLGEGAPPVVRIAAAHWAHAVAQALDAAEVDAALAACAADLSQPSVARSCASPAIEPGVEDADLIATDAEGHALPGRLVALRLADGSALVTYTDARGRVRLADAPIGPLSLDAPESAVLVP